MKEIGEIVRRFCGVFLLLLTCVGSLAAESPDDLDMDCYDNSWCEPVTFNVGVFGWTPYFDGDLTIKGNIVDMDVSFTELVEESDSKAIYGVRAEVQRGCWGAYADFHYGKLGFKTLRTQTGGLTIDMDLDFYVAEMAMHYQLTRLFHGRYCTLLDLLAGARYVRYDVDMNLSSGSAEKGTLDWLDPIIGIRTTTDLGCCWELILQGDVGGGEVMGSDLSWQAQGGLRYNYCFCGCSGHTLLFYRALHQDYKRGAPAGGSSVDMLQHGPFVGLQWVF